VVALGADDDSVGMREHSADSIASALHINEEGVGGRHQALLLVSVLLSADGGVKKVVLDDRHFEIRLK